MQITASSFNANMGKTNFNPVIKGEKGESSGALTLQKKDKKDYASENLKAQINALRERMQDISANADLDEKTKSELTQNLQEQMMSLNKQLTQRQSDFLKEQQEEEKENDPQNTEAAEKSSRKFDKYEPRESGQSSGLSARTAGAILAAGNAMDMSKIHKDVALSKEGRANELKKEISKDIREVMRVDVRGVPDPVNPDRAPAGIEITETWEIQRGAAVQAKENEVTELELGAESAKESQVRTLASAVNLIKEAEEEGGKEKGLDTGSEEAEGIYNNVDGVYNNSGNISSSFSVQLTFDKLV